MIYYPQKLLVKIRAGLAEYTRGRSMILW